MVERQRAEPAAPTTNPSGVSSASDELTQQTSSKIRTALTERSMDIDGKLHTAEFIEGSDPEVQRKIQEFHDFMAEPGHILHEELADPETFTNVLRRGDIALNHIKNGRFEELTAKTQPYFVINIRDPATGEIVSAMSGAMIVDRASAATNGVDATFMLSYVATKDRARGRGLPQKIANQVIAYFQEKNVHVTGMLTEAVDTFEKGANKINNCARLYVRREAGKGKTVMQQIEYLMPSQEYSLDGDPLQGTTSSSNLMMSFAGKDPTQGIPGREIKAKLSAMWNWVYRRDEAYYAQKYAEQGLEPDPKRIVAAVGKNEKYIDDLLSRIYAQFGDDELVFPVTAKEREASTGTFTKVPVEQVERATEFHLEELSPGDLESVVKLTSTVFPNDGEHPKRCFEASLNPNDAKNQAYLTEINVDSLNYWVAKGTDGAILGIVGFYTTPGDKADVGWVGWYCVDPKARGLGVGTQLLNCVEGEALTQKKKALRLYTSDRDTMTTANLQYEKRGYKEIHREPSKTHGTTIIIRQKDLVASSGGHTEESVPPLNPKNIVVL